MKKFRIHAQMREDLYTIVEAETLEEAQEKAEEVAMNGGMERDKQFDGDFLWNSELDKEAK